MWRDVKLRYKQTGFGAAWALIQPVALTVVFTIFLNRVAGISSYGDPYPVFAFSGLLVWTLLRKVCCRSAESLLSSAQMVSKVYFPRLVLPIASACSYVIDFMVGSVLLLLLLARLRSGFGPRLLLAPRFCVEALVVAVSMGIWLSAIERAVPRRPVHAPVPDPGLALRNPGGVLRESDSRPYQTLAGLNPMSGVVQGFRWSVTGGRERPAGDARLSTVVTFATLFIGLIYFSAPSKRLRT